MFLYMSEIEEKHSVPIIQMSYNKKGAIVYTLF